MIEGRPDRLPEQVGGQMHWLELRPICWFGPILYVYSIHYSLVRTWQVESLILVVLLVPRAFHCLVQVPKLVHESQTLKLHLLWIYGHAIAFRTIYEIIQSKWSRYCFLATTMFWDKVGNTSLLQTSPNIMNELMRLSAFRKLVTSVIPQIKRLRSCWIPGFRTSVYMSCIIQHTYFSCQNFDIDHVHHHQTCFF